jgi:Zn-dependent protease
MIHQKDAFDAVASILVHEVGHLVTAFVLRVKVKQIGITWKGPYIRRESGTPSRNLAITLAGPGVNILLALLTRHIYPGFALNNLVLGLFNLLPIHTFDGHRAFHAITAISSKPIFSQLAGGRARTGARSTASGRNQKEWPEKEDEAHSEVA